MRTKIKMTDSAIMRLQDGHERFILEKKAMNLSNDTIGFYNVCYRYLTEYVGENALCSEINADTIINYILHLRERSNISDTTINTYLSGTRAILYNLMERGLIKNSMMA